jgi:hypothetical protein
MRMVCDSSYLLDPATDHGVKADELVALLDDLFADPQEKVVVFSQWRRMHEVLIRRFEARGWGHVLFHGGVPSSRRQALVDRFRDDPDCRLFLATDAGSTGLNLQHAATVVNIDLPWNPAVLEQRVARIHRLGQQRPIRVVNFVARGSIEEGMLSVLAFKRSLSAGILDGGTGEISLGGSRLNRFMKDVENVTGHMGEGEAMTPAEEAAGVATVTEAASVPEANAQTEVGAGGTAIPESVSEAPPDQATLNEADPWQALTQLGAQLVAALGAAGNPAAPAHPWIERDPGTGAQSLKLPLPPPETAGKIADVLSMIANALRGQRP